MISVGERFGKLLVLGNFTKRGNHPYVECECDCGNIKSICVYNIIKGRSTSCGCMCKSKQKHGMSKEKQYMVWNEMKRRCNDKGRDSYKHYGGRGISYDQKRETFEGFWDDMKEGYKEGLSLERINVNGNYCKENCKRINIEKQAQNKRNTRYETYKGETKRLKDRAKIFGLSYVRVTRRLYMGRTIEKSLETPINKKYINQRYK